MWCGLVANRDATLIAGSSTEGGGLQKASVAADHLAMAAEGGSTSECIEAIFWNYTFYVLKFCFTWL
jgi:hypothetical protein